MAKRFTLMGEARAVIADLFSEARRWEGSV